MVAIELSSVTKEFRRPGVHYAYLALSGLSLSIEEGEFVCLIGPTGCGKSTVLHLIAGFEQPTQGEVRVFGSRVDRPGADRGVVFQSDLALFSWLTVEENVEYGLKVRGVTSRDRKDIVGLHLGLVGLEAHRHKFPRELSGGMKQRVQIARVLANDPRILLMDEPFGALDAQTRRHLQQQLVRIWLDSRKTVVFVTHDVGEAVWLADRICILSSGPQARVKTLIECTLPRPRDRMTLAFVDLFNRVTDEIDSAAGSGQ